MCNFLQQLQRNSSVAAALPAIWLFDAPSCRGSLRIRRYLGSGSGVGRVEQHRVAALKNLDLFPGGESAPRSGGRPDGRPRDAGAAVFAVAPGRVTRRCRRFHSWSPRKPIVLLKWLLFLWLRFLVPPGGFLLSWLPYPGLPALRVDPCNPVLSGIQGPWNPCGLLHSLYPENLGSRGPATQDSRIYSSIGVRGIRARDRRRPNHRR